MIDTEKRDAFLSLIAKPAAVGGLLGDPYVEDGCAKFVMRVLPMIGIDSSGNIREDGRHWEDIKNLENNRPQFGDLAVFQDLPFSKFHVALMLDQSLAIQSSLATNGVGKIDITTDQWRWALRTIYRHKSLCS